MTTQYIYLLQEREFVNASENVFKIGKSKQINVKRIKQYPKGSILLVQVACSNCDAMEKDLIRIFKKKYTHRSDIGAEYFEGDQADMSRVIYQKVFEYMPEFIADEQNYEIDDNSSEDEENSKINTKHHTINDSTLSEVEKLKESIRKKTRFVCDLCDKCFKSQKGLEYHTEHKACKETPYDCRHCDKGFATESNMYRHMRSSCEVKKLKDTEAANKQKETEDKLTQIENELIKEKVKNEKLRNKVKVLKKI